MAITINGTNGLTTDNNALKFDTDVLVVDDTNNRVGIGESAPASKLEITAGGNSVGLLRLNESDASNLSGYMQFDSNGTNKANVQNANNAGIHVCVGTGGSVVFTALGYTAANALDDYEEGTWTPTFDTGFPSGSPEEVVQGASYTKIGSVVIAVARIQARNDASGMQLGGLPYNANTDQAAGTISHDSHTARKERMFAGNDHVNWEYSSTSSSLANQYYMIVYRTDS